MSRFLEGLRSDADAHQRLVHLHEEAACEASFERLPDDLPAGLRHSLEAAGLSGLYSHQREAIDHARAGRNVVVSTATSSGKTLCFQLPVLSEVMKDPSATALFLFPTNPLANDQEVSLQRLLERLPEEQRPRGPVRLQGDMGAKKDRLAAEAPQIVLTNPEMAHLHLLPRHRMWRRFWEGLRYLVVDEIHLYRGAFGGHLSHLLRRVRRCAWRYGASPVVIAASATLGNPRGLAEELCAAPFELVERSGAPRQARTTVLWKPPEEGWPRPSYVDESVNLFRRALAEGLTAILFARSRQLVEQMVARLEEETGRTRVALGVRAYRGGYLRDEREAIEAGLRKGTVRGVVTTNALEVGIDIGALDVCIIAGYPGSVMATRQQAGRVGRRDRPAAVILVAAPNPLDAWLLDHPQSLLSTPSERAVVGRLNAHVLKAHLACAAAEFPLWEAEIERLGGAAAGRAVEELVAAGEARWTREGERKVLAVGSRPHHSVSLRSATQERWHLEDPSAQRLGEIDGSAVYREAHPGAIYLHQGRTFRVQSLENGRVVLERARPGTFTRVQAERSVSVLEVSSSRELPGGGEVKLASLAVVDRYASFLESSGPGRAPRGRRIEPPLESRLETEGLVLEIPERVRARFGATGGASLSAALHGAEHLLSSFASAMVLCDRDELEAHTIDEVAPAIAIFDRHPGGMGLAAAAFQSLEDLLERSLDAVTRCSCAEGCPGCIHSGRCLRTSDELSKGGARLLLALICGRDVGAVPVVEPVKPRRRRRAERLASVEEAVSARVPESTDSFTPGERVEHAAFGGGTVVEVTSSKVVVLFDEGRRRRIRPEWLRRS